MRFPFVGELFRGSSRRLVRATTRFPIVSFQILSHLWIATALAGAVGTMRKHLGNSARRRWSCRRRSSLRTSRLQRLVEPMRHDQLIEHPRLHSLGNLDVRRRALSPLRGTWSVLPLHVKPARHCRRRQRGTMRNHAPLALFRPVSASSGVKTYFFSTFLNSQTLPFSSLVWNSLSVSLVIVVL
jgi:hypothetical protein